MPGQAIPVVLRQLIYKFFEDGKSSCATIDALFSGPNAPRTVSRKHMEHLWRKFSDPSFVKNDYLCGPANNSGRPRMLGPIQSALVCDLAQGSQKKRKANRISTIYNNSYHGENSGVAQPSTDTMVRTLKRGRVSKKVAERCGVDYLG